MSAFEQMREGGFSALDAALIDAFDSIWPGSDKSALHLAALNSWAVGRGHSCFTPELLAEWPSGTEPGLRERAIHAWHEALRSGAWPQAAFIGSAGSDSPIVVEGERAGHARRRDLALRLADHGLGDQTVGHPEVGE